MAFVNRDINTFRSISSAPRLRDVLRWRIKSSPFEMYSRASDIIPVVNTDIGSLKKKRNFILWIGHSSLMIDLDGRRILIDPVFTNRLLTVKRAVSLNYDLNDLLPIDYVLISHNHIDHLESNVLRIIRNSARYLIPLGLDYFMKRYRVSNYVSFDWYESFKERGIEFIFVPAQHWSQRGPFDRNRSLWGGFIIRSSRITIYYAGDTGYFDIFSKLKKLYGNIDLSILPIGAYAPRWFSYKNHMSPYDALKAFCDLSSDRFLPVHWGAFRLGREGVDEPIRRLFSLWEKENIEEERLIFLPVGGVYSLPGMSKTA